MNRPSIQLFAGGVAATVVGFAVEWFAGYTLLAVVTGVVWGGWVAMLVRIRQEYPTFVTGDGWGDSRWTGLGVALTMAAAVLGVSPTLPMSPELRGAIEALVLGAGSAGYMAATLAELERADGRRGAAESSSGGTRVESADD